MKKLVLFVICAVLVLALAVSLMMISRASSGPVSGATAAQTEQDEVLLRQLDSALLTMANQLHGKVTKGRSGAPERCITWTAQDGTAMSHRVWLTGGNGKSTLHMSLQASRPLAGMTQSFNLQYLNLQNQMQNENRQFTMVSNIMKTKHDTSKNAISNIR